MSLPARSSWLEIGTMVRAHGLRGELCLRLHDPTSDVLFQVDRLFVGPKSPSRSKQPPPTDVSLIPYTIKNVRSVGNGLYLVILAGVLDRSSAETLQAAAVLVKRDDLAPLANDEMYVADAVGWRVVEKEKVLGIIERVEHVGTQNWWVLQGDIWIPAVPSFLIRFDKEQQILFVELPEGLLELNARP